MEDSKIGNLNLNEIWKACRKIQDTIFRYGFDLCAEFCPHDPKKKGVVSESLFSSILSKYKRVVGLSDFEIREITDYFRLRDGRVDYKQFCMIVCGESFNRKEKKDMVTGHEWSDPMHVNAIPRPEDRRQLCLILIKIAQTSHLPLQPYFQDYELITKNSGVVTVAHFSRVLHFMKIPISDKDFLLLLKRYMKDSFLVNYIAFITHIQKIIDFLKERNLSDNAQHIIKNFPGKLVDLDLPELPALDGTSLAQKIFKDYCSHPQENKTDGDVVKCIQRQVLKYRIRVKQFLECFDLLHTGTITINQFHRGLDNMGIGKFLKQSDFHLLCCRYIDPIDMNRIRWRAFEDEIDSVFTIKNLEKMPLREVVTPPEHIKEMPQPGALNWRDVNEKTRDCCEEAIRKIQIRIQNRRLYLHPFFRNFDKLNSGHVRCTQAAQIFTTNAILLSNDEMNALVDRYGNEMGFHYTKFLEDVDPAQYATPKLIAPSSMTAACPVYQNEAEQDTEENIIRILTKAKRQAITKSIRVIDFLIDYDRHREGEILEVDFRRGLDNANIKMLQDEVDTICKIFRSPKRACCVLYRDFCKALDEIFIQIETVAGDNEVTAVPLIHLANLDCTECFLNFEERAVCSHALMKLARKPDEISNLSAAFKDFDRENCGTIRKSQLMRALTVRDMHYIISNREFEAVFKCFALQRGVQLEFNYREFLRILGILYTNGQIKRNY